MRDSPSKVTFNYPHHHTHLSNYSTRLIQSGFVLGDPVALTDAPRLPSDYQSFSPNRSRPRAATDLISSSRLVDYRAPKPTQFAPPPPAYRPSPSWQPPAKVQANSVPQEDYSRLLFQYSTLQQRYNSLQEKYYQLQAENRSPLQKSMNQDDITRLIERYRQNLLDQCKLLVDRARLEQRETEVLKNSRR